MGIYCFLWLFPVSYSISLDIHDINLITERAYTLSSYNQLITSSTLGWANIEDIQSGVIDKNNVVLLIDSAICRVRDGDKILPGRADRSGNCLVGGTKISEYQVLVDLGGTSRTEWKYWDMFSYPVMGTVAYNKNKFVASIELNNLKKGAHSKKGKNMIIGELDYKSGMNGEITANLFSSGKNKIKTKGKALVEIEPIKYRLEDIDFNINRMKITKDSFVIGDLQLNRNKDNEYDNNESDWTEVTDVVRYTYPAYSYWGHIDGTVKGLPSTVLINETRKQFRWGLEEYADVDEKYIVSVMMSTGTALNISLSGNLVRKEMPFTATLVMVYRDGMIVRKNQISSTYIYQRVENIHEQTERHPFYLDSGLPAPTTTTTTLKPSTASMSSLDSASHLRENEIWDVVPTPTSTLFPLPPPPETKPNPLHQFYPEGGSWESYTSPPKLSTSVHMSHMVSTAACLISANYLVPIIMLLFLYQHTGVR